MPLPNYSRIGPLRRENCTRDHKAGATRLADRFSRGDILVLSREERRPSWSSALERFIPRECCVLEAGEDWITVSVGPSWPTGLWEARRRPGAVGVRLDRAAPQGPLKAQRESLQLTQQGDAGEAAMLMATDAAAMREAAATPPPRFSEGVSVDCSTLPFGVDHLEQAACHAIAEAKGASREMRRGYLLPNESQEQAIAWALCRRLSLVCGPPGTGKSSTAALLIATALKLRGCSSSAEAEASPHPRVLAVAHSNGAADVLLQAA